jgi:hypothetical protein
MAAVDSAFQNRAGQRCLYPMGITNSMLNGSDALFLAQQIVAGGIYDLCVGLGCGKNTQTGSMGSMWRSEDWQAFWVASS